MCEIYGFISQDLVSLVNILEADESRLFCIQGTEIIRNSDQKVMGA